MVYDTVLFPAWHAYSCLRARARHFTSVQAFARPLPEGRAPDRLRANPSRRDLRAAPEGSLHEDVLSAVRAQLPEQIAECAGLCLAERVLGERRARALPKFALVEEYDSVLVIEAHVVFVNVARQPARVVWVCPTTTVVDVFITLTAKHPELFAKKFVLKECPSLFFNGKPLFSGGNFSPGCPSLESHGVVALSVLRLVSCRTVSVCTPLGDFEIPLEPGALHKDVLNVVRAHVPELPDDGLCLAECRPGLMPRPLPKDVCVQDFDRKLLIEAHQVFVKT